MQQHAPERKPISFLGDDTIGNDTIANQREENQQESRESLTDQAQDIVLAITDLIANPDPLPDLFDRMAPHLAELTGVEVLNFALYEPGSNVLNSRLWKDGEQTRTARFTIEEAPCGWVWQNQKPLTIPDVRREHRFSQMLSSLSKMGVTSYSSFPLSALAHKYGAIGFGSVHPRFDSVSELHFLQQASRLVALAVKTRELANRATSHVELTQADRDAEDDVLSEIIGDSRALRRVLEYAAVVARTDATVLITGETGTGKERVARAVHYMSRRRDNAFIKLNCAAIPTGLLESELFGHEKGAFTGAVSQKVGRLELADKGTLLLDEVGEIPLELQPKLLRVLQDQEFERLGGTRTIRVNVRVIAASNRDLVRAVAEKHFRSDLFYRLHVFPLHLPPLRERREDIPLLIRHFVERCSVRIKKKIDIIPDDAVQTMVNWDWPGNIRELENFIERSVILSEDNRLRAPLNELVHPAGYNADSAGTLRDREREHIIDILRQTRGVLSGPTGAAHRLGLKRTTLQYKMQRLGISRHDYLN